LGGGDVGNNNESPIVASHYARGQRKNNVVRKSDRGGSTRPLGPKLVIV